MGMRTGSGTGRQRERKREQERDRNGDKDGSGDGNEDGIGEGGREAKKGKKPHKSCRRHVGNGGDLGGKTRRQERVCSVAANSDNLENKKEAGGGAQGTQGLS